ncbi:MAG: DUF4331 family protein [Chitinophagaceae bacterium]|nr:DUF4331 family protein [Chitinophagaceae bacterium]MCB0740147.1 DUF4331 family protein [Chitinophagaceae bacterium]HQU56191.1 DUF4331 family protein [Chitinophagaceae bacterium]HQV06462.1 DUF4331 family protein [Chitinophagaceae bacterium]
MKSTIKLIAIIFTSGVLISSCKKNDTMSPTVYYEQQDQMGRPGINTVFVADVADKETFNVTTPSLMGAAFQSKFQARLSALNPGYTVNVLGLDNTTFTSVLATDVLNVSTTGPTKFFTSTTDYLTGRGLADDVIDNELTLIFGGSTGASNPGLTSDHVNANDKVFLTSFPYLASPW